MLALSLPRAVRAIFLLCLSFTSLSLVHADPNPIPLVCHDTGVQIIAMVGTNVTNGSLSFGLSTNFFTYAVAHINDSNAISLNYNRVYPLGQGGKYFVPETALGTQVLLQAIQNYTTACPNTPLVLHGYSQGGCALMNAICGQSAPWAATSPLSTSYVNNIVAIILYGEETWVAGQPQNFGGCTASAPNLARSNSNACSPFLPVMMSYCLPNDPNCCSTYNASNPNATDGRPWHWQYPIYYDNIVQNYIVSQLDKFHSITPTQNEIPAGVTTLGCYFDSANRTLPYQFASGGNMTPQTCINGCTISGYEFSGVENGNECWCGSTQPAQSLLVPGCGTLCAGDSNQFCGGGWQLIVSHNPNTIPLAAKLPTGVVPMGCFQDQSPRTLPINMYYGNASNSNTNCAQMCSAAGYPYSGTEYADECFCGNTAPTGAVSNSSCNMACSGNQYQLCGSGWLLTIQHDTTLASKTATSLPSGIVPVGCYRDQNPRTLPYAAYSNSSNTNNLCSLTCRSLGFTYSGTEYGNECYCGNTAPPASAALANSSCNSFCAADGTILCGGGWALSIMNDTKAAPAVVAPLPSGFSAVGCYVDSNTRVLPTLLYDNSSNTENFCALGCRAAGYKYSGTEYASQCYCGNTKPAASLLASTSDCSMTCANAVSNQLCGAGWRLQVIQDTTAKTASSSAGSSNDTTVTRRSLTKGRYVGSREQTFR